MTLGQTPSQTVGPFYTIGLCRRSDNELVEPFSPEILRIHEGFPVGDGRIRHVRLIERPAEVDGTDAQLGSSVSRSLSHISYTIL